MSSLKNGVLALDKIKENKEEEGDSDGSRPKKAGERSTTNKGKSKAETSVFSQSSGVGFCNVEDS